MTTLYHIIIGAPLWVWPLCAVLVALGVRARRARDVSVASYYPLPFFGLISITGLVGTPAPGATAPMFIAAYALGLWLGDRAQGGLIVAKADGRVSVRGDWITLAALMALFWSSFAGGYVDARQPELAASPFWIGGLAAVSGLVSGQFGGRALRVIRAPTTRADDANDANDAVT